MFFYLQEDLKNQATRNLSMVVILDKVVEETLSEDGKELNLKGYCVGPNGMTIITRDERLVKVRRLNLGGNRIGDDGVKMLTESDLFAKVNWIELGGNDIGPEGVSHLIRSKVFKKVKSLNLYRNYIKDEGAAARRLRSGPERNWR